MRNALSSLLLASAVVAMADVPYNAPAAGNPVLPGYFADPTVKKFGDNFYIYATTDGSGAGFGPAQLWISKDFVNWTLMPMNWPDSHWIWAPDVVQNPADSLYYYLYCQPCQLHLGVGPTPRGPWRNVLGDSEAVLVPDRFVTNAITLDGQTFIDDDGSMYMYWGTWGIYPGFGCGAGKLNADMKSFSETRLIPNTEVTDFFEAPFVLKRGDTYYFMYSSGHCEDHSYRVQYATSKNPLGPYEYQGTILNTSDDGTVHGPGHHSVLKDGDDYYIVYHRHDNPHSNRGFHRQVCIDKLEFDKKGKIKPVVPTHAGIGKLGTSSLKSPNLAYGAAVRASSSYDSDFRPEYAVDQNNGTLWRPASLGKEWIEIDLGAPQQLSTVWTLWEYGTQFYQYAIETSLDGKEWSMFADRRNNTLAGSPMVDFGNAMARYLRITSTGGQKRGFPGALWEVKAFGGIEEGGPQQWVNVTGSDWDGVEWRNDGGMLSGSFQVLQGQVTPVRIDGRDALQLQPGTQLVFENPMIGRQGEAAGVALVYNGEQWSPQVLGDWVSPGMISISATSEPLTIAALYYANWNATQPEVNYALTSPKAYVQAADNHTRGLLVDISADAYAVGDTVPYLENGKGIKGYYETKGLPVVIEEIKGRKAMKFDGQQTYISSFPLPPTMRDNCPYTLEAWILNPEMAENECIADFTSSHDEMEKIMMVNGTEPRCGVMQHYGWYEDAGWPDVKKLEGEWLHLVVTFDGRIERVSINDHLVSEKDIQLLVKPSQYIILGRNAEREWPFTGYVHSIRLWDEAR